MAKEKKETVVKEKTSTAKGKIPTADAASKDKELTGATGARAPALRGLGNGAIGCIMKGDGGQIVQVWMDMDRKGVIQNIRVEPMPMSEREMRNGIDQAMDPKVLADLEEQARTLIGSSAMELMQQQINQGNNPLAFSRRGEGKKEEPKEIGHKPPELEAPEFDGMEGEDAIVNNVLTGKKGIKW